MIHILQGYSLTDVRLASMFADRKALFVDLMRWSVPVVDGAYEIDQFDGADATYLIAVEHGEHVGSMRLLPADRPHILDSLFPDLCDTAVPAGTHVAEITRLCLPCRLGTARRLEIRNRLISAMVDHAATAGIASLTGVVSSGFLAQILRMGWHCERLGKARRHFGSSLAAFRVDLDAHSSERLAEAGIYTPGAIVAPLARAA
ncbi:acyl-homoserine-lactone synthase [Sphingobium naphthae]|jgi:acyl-homoserine lactone synthase|uniref:acyl-homoserine-lactone synthase n=1 Tax=Sphingobium naphthae TaxID=1886786 RepID=UPI0037483722